MGATTKNEVIDNIKPILRVLHVMDNLRVASGIASIVMNIYRNIDRNKIQFDFLVVFNMENNYSEEIMQMGGKIHYLNSPSRDHISKLIRSYIQYVKSVSCFFAGQGKEYTVIHSHTATLSGPVFKEAKKQGIKCRILHSHSISYSDNNSLIKNVRNIIFISSAKKRANQYLACSAQAGAFLYGHKTFSRGLVPIIKNGIEISRFSFSSNIRTEYRQAMGLDQHFVVGHVGRMIALKNQFKLLRIFATICKKRNDAILLFVGVGDLHDKLIETAKELGITNNVRFLGVRKDIDKLMQAMDCFVMPSLTEGLSLVTVEAQAAGLPVFVSEGIPDDACIVNTTKISLAETEEIWATNIIEKTASHIRSNNSLEIANAGYDISVTANRLQELYLTSKVN